MGIPSPEMSASTYERIRCQNTKRPFCCVSLVTCKRLESSEPENGDILFTKCSCVISIHTTNEFHKVNKFGRNIASSNTTEQHYKCGALKVRMVMVVTSTTKMKTVQFGVVT